MENQITVEERGTAAVVWQRGPRHKFYEDRYRLLCRPVPLVAGSGRGDLFAVCDGVGSAEMGMAAAQEVCTALADFYGKGFPATAESLADLLTGANGRIRSWGMIEGTDRSLGACAGTVVWVDEDMTARIFHAGDTSAILVRDGIARPLTAEQHSPDGHLANYFGLDDLELEFRSLQLEEGDRLLIMSDGVTKALSFGKIVGIVESEPTRAASLRALVRAARAAGSGDDATALLVDIEFPE